MGGVQTTVWTELAWVIGGQVQKVITPRKEFKPYQTDGMGYQSWEELTTDGQPDHIFPSDSLSEWVTICCSITEFTIDLAVESGTRSSGCCISAPFFARKSFFFVTEDTCMAWYPLNDNSVVIPDQVVGFFSERDDKLSVLPLPQIQL